MDENLKSENSLQMCYANIKKAWYTT